MNKLRTNQKELNQLISKFKIAEVFFLTFYAEFIVLTDSTKTSKIKDLRKLMISNEKSSSVYQKFAKENRMLFLNPDGSKKTTLPYRIAANDGVYSSVFESRTLDVYFGSELFNIMFPNEKVDYDKTKCRNLFEEDGEQDDVWLEIVRARLSKLSNYLNQITKKMEIANARTIELQNAIIRSANSNHDLADQATNWVNNHRYAEI